jgi:hypothetical protein
VVVPAGDGPAWGLGGPAATAAVLGRLEASLREAAEGARRCQRQWRLQQVPKCLKRRAKRERAAVALQRWRLAASAGGLLPRAAFFLFFFSKRPHSPTNPHPRRCVRGWVARAFVSLYKPLRHLAAVLVQKVRRETAAIHPLRAR